MTTRPSHVRSLSVAALLAATVAPAFADQFSTVGSTIYDPAGNVFIPRGVNVAGFNSWIGHDPTYDVHTIADAWGFNLIRANCLPVTLPAELKGSSINLDNMVAAYTTDRI